MNAYNEQMEQIVELVGEDATLRLCRVFAGETVYFPKTVLVHLEHEEIRKEYSGGASYRELSIKYGRTTRQIRDIIHNYKPDERQQALF